MHKKLLLYCLLFCSVQVTKPFILETLAFIGVVSLIKTPMGKFLSKQVFEKNRIFKQSRKYFLKSDNILPTFEKMGFQAQGKAYKALLACKARISNVTLKNPFARCVQNFKTESTTITQFKPCDVCKKTCPSSFEPAAATLNMQINSAQATQSSCGLFPKITNNYYTGTSDDLVAEKGKSKFWKGAFFGGLITAWVFKKQESISEKKH